MKRAKEMKVVCLQDMEGMETMKSNVYEFLR